MSIIDQTLLADEHILYRTRKHFIIFFNPMVWTIATIFLLFTPKLWIFHSNIFLAKVALLPALIAAVLAAMAWINQWLNYVTSEFVVTDKRILMREGFFTRHTNELRLATVSNVTVNQSLLGQMLDYGVIVINPFGGTNDVFIDVAHPFEFQKQTQTQLEKVVER